jgi:preprotein translocase subunit Sec61beta
MDSRIYPHSELYSAVHSASRKVTPDLVYQIAIVVAALLLVITASLF